MSRGLAELRRVVPEHAVLVPAVSRWSVGMHVHHVSLAMIEVCRSLVESEPPPPRSRFRILTWAVLTVGRIPRGRAESPDPALPREGIGPEELSALLDDCDAWMSRAERAMPGQWFRHFVFGVLDRDRTLQFLEVHNRHHLRIVQDILDA
jgi:hypothetical protein